MLILNLTLRCVTARIVFVEEKNEQPNKSKSKNKNKNKPKKVRFENIYEEIIKIKEKNTFSKYNKNKNIKIGLSKREAYWFNE